MQKERKLQEETNHTVNQYKKNLIERMKIKLQNKVKYRINTQQLKVIMKET